MKELGCTFVMNPPASSHMGGVWERQIRTVRSVLTTKTLFDLFYSILLQCNIKVLNDTHCNYVQHIIQVTDYLLGIWSLFVHDQPVCIKIPIPI